jgi:glycosyltransferase involved in cell wall biosynthesis
MNNPLFSILIAQYNNGHFFKDCYQSILEQTYTNWEVIIVDDVSTDDSIEVIRELIQNDSRFKLFLNDKNNGCGFTKHRCATLATGVFCGFLDPDDTLESSALEEMISAHLISPEVSIVTSKYYRTDLELKNKIVCNHGEAIPSNYSYLTYGKAALTHFATFKNCFYKQTQGIDEKFKRAVDQDLYYKLEEVGSHLFLDKALYNYRVNHNSISANKNVFKAEYWHFLAKKDAFNRRLVNNLKVDNFTKIEFNKVIYDFYNLRMKRECARRNIYKKYYFLIKLFCLNFSHQLKYKMKCLLFPLYC